MLFNYKFFVLFMNRYSEHAGPVHDHHVYYAYEPSGPPHDHSGHVTSTKQLVDLVCRFFFCKLTILKTRLKHKNKLKGLYSYS